MDDLAQLMPSLGGLHDARVLRVTWHGDRRRLEMVIDDLYANSLGLPGYEGPRRSTIVFERVTRLVCAVDLGEYGLMVFDCAVAANPGGYDTHVSFSPGGSVSVTSDAPKVEA